MTPLPLDIVVLGLSLSSAWGNGHATTYRSLLRGLHKLGHHVHFLERDVPWYASHRDLPEPEFCTLDYYSSTADLVSRYADDIRQADAVVVGSYVPQGPEVIDAVAALKPGKLVFYDIDTPVTLGKLARGDEEYLARRQIPLFDTYFSFTGGPTLIRLETDYGAQRAVPLYCSVDEENYRNTSEPVRWDLGYLGTYSQDRQGPLERLLIDVARRLPKKRFVVAGPQYPGRIDWPQNVERIEHLPPAAHASFYSRQRFTLNVTRADMVAAGWSPSVRLFEAAACGTAIISDYWDGLGELLPEGEAVAVGRTTEDVVKLLTKTSESDRIGIGEAARRIVLRRHTGEARARDLVRHLTLRPRPEGADVPSISDFSTALERLAGSYAK